jgi:hypothetical protein
MLCTFMLGVPSAASALISNQGSSFFSMTNDLGFFSEFQPVAFLEVGNANVPIGGFGVYGEAEANGQIRWVIVDVANSLSPLLYVSGTQNVSPQGPGWYDSPGISQTLQANRTYAMGVVASNLFAWSLNDAPSGPIIQGDLTIPVDSHQLQVALDGAGHFAGDPIYPGLELPGIQTSLRVLAPIPEPAEWSMLIAGLLVIAFIARRRNQFLPHPTDA